MATKFVVLDWDPVALALLKAAGVDPNMCSRMVLDLQVGRPGKMYLETYADRVAMQSIELSPEVAAGISVVRPRAES